MCLKEREKGFHGCIILSRMHDEVSEVRVKLGVTSGYARPPKVRDISSKYHPPLLVVAPTFRTRF